MLLVSRDDGSSLLVHRGRTIIHVSRDGGCALLIRRETRSTSLVHRHQGRTLSVRRGNGGTLLMSGDGGRTLRVISGVKSALSLPEGKGVTLLRTREGQAIQRGHIEAKLLLGKEVTIAWRERGRGWPRKLWLTG